MKHLAIGTVMIALGLWGLFTWWDLFGLVMRGVVPFALLVLGLLAVLSSYYRLGDATAAGGDAEGRVSQR